MAYQGEKYNGTGGTTDSKIGNDGCIAGWRLGVPSHGNQTGNCKGYHRQEGYDMSRQMILRVAWIFVICLIVSTIGKAQAQTHVIELPTSDVFVLPIEPERLSDSVAALIRPGAKAADLTVTDLPNESVAIAVKHATLDGKVQGGPVLIGKKGDVYTITQDYAKYCPVTLPDGRRIRVGIAIRIRADVTVTGKEVKLSGLLPLGLSAAKSEVEGTLRVDVIGISNREITSAMPMPAQLSQETIVNALLAFSTAKARVYDGSRTSNSGAGGDAGDAKPPDPASATFITPQIIAREYRETELTPFKTVMTVLGKTGEEKIARNNGYIF
jgi:hypothetical protein